MAEKVTVGKYLAIEPLNAQKVEATLSGGIARAAARSEVIIAKLVMSYKPSFGADYGAMCDTEKVILPGEAPFQPWNKKIYEMPDGTKFVLCPVDFAIGFQE